MDGEEHRLARGAPFQWTEEASADCFYIERRAAPLQPQPRPWSNFTASNLLPNSVYLWACDEAHQTGDSRPSRSDACVGWVVLITQIMCYIQLIVVSSTGRKGNPSTSSSTIVGGSYSLVSVAAAMYLMTSIVGADLGAGIALLSERRSTMCASELGAEGANGWRWVQRKAFGLTLVLSFLLLAVASIRVLFYSSLEDVDLVVGAATVLFIADVDEKMMVVLRVIPSKWRLFCVLEVIGLSGTFALLGLRATENGSEVSESYLAGCNYGIGEVAEGCYIYSWFFILTYHPVTVTILALLVNAIVAGPKGFMKRHLFGNCSFKGCSFTTALALWILAQGSYRFFSDEWLFGAYVLFFVIYAAALVVWLLFATYKRFAYGGSQGSTASSSNSFRWTWSRNMGLFYMPVGLFLLGIVVVVLAAASGVTGPDVDLLNPTWDPFLVMEAVYSLLYNLWLVWAVCKSSTSVTSLLPEVVTVVAEVQEPVAELQGISSRRFSPLTRDLLLGWAHANALYIAFSLCLSELVLPFIERTGISWAYLPLFTMYWFVWTWIGVCAAASNTKGVAFWAVASWLLYYVAYCIWVWYQAVMSGSVK